MATTTGIKDFVAGSTKLYKFNFTKTENDITTPVDITSWEILTTIKANKNDLDVDAALLKTTVAGSYVTDDVINGLMHVELTTVDTDVPAGTYTIEFLRKDSSVTPANIKTIRVDKIKINERLRDDLS